MKRIIEKDTSKNNEMILSDKIIGDDGISGKYRKKNIYKNINDLQVVNIITKNYDSYCVSIASIKNKNLTICRGKNKILG